MAESTVPFKITWGSKKFDVNADPSQGIDVFRGLLMSLTGVPPEKQKILRRKVVIDSDAALLELKPKARLKLIGSAVVVEDKKIAVVFAEDLSATEQAKLADSMPPGLYNLGNTCYLNATVQCLKCVEPLNDALQQFGSTSLNPSVSKTLGELFRQMNSTKESFQPMRFVMLFRQAFPRFAQMDEQRRGFLQQDAGEFLVELLGQIQRDQVGDNIAKNLFEIEFERTEKCTVNDDAQTSSHSDPTLTCFVNKNVSHLIFGLQGGLDTEIEKFSETAGQQVIWKRTDRITKLPEYINVNISRFQWKQTEEGGVNCKQLRRVAFPHKLDIASLCVENLKARIMKYRQAKIDWEDEMREKKQSEGLGLEEENKPKEKTEDQKPEEAVQPAEAMETEEPQISIPPVAGGVPASSLEQPEVANADQGDAAPAEAMEIEEPAKIVNETGEYELIGIVTHKGRGANSGHYIGYGKDSKTKRWIKYDDEDVMEVKETDIESLYGGGDFQMGYICFYKKIAPVDMTAK